MKKEKLITIATYTILILLSVITVYPLFWISTISFKTVREYVASPISLPNSLNLANYVHVLLVDKRVIRFLLNSFIVTTSSVGLILLFSVPAAYCLSRLKFIGRDVILMFFLFNFMIPIILFITPLYVLLTKLGLLGSYWSIILPYVASRLGLSIFILRSFFRTIPSSVEDAAKLDGCNLFKIMYLICLPAIRSGIFVVVILNFIAVWNEFFLAYVILQDQAMFTLPPGISVFRYQYSANWPYMSVAIVISVIPSLFMFYFFQDKILQGWGYTEK